jgi:hypothetical protein
MAYTNTLRSSSEIRLLKNLINKVASKCSELMTLATLGAPYVRTSLDMPISVGNSQYWIRIANDSDQTWIEGGLGQLTNDYAQLITFLPKGVYATGTFVSSYGPIILECNLEVTPPRLTINGVHESE